MTLPFAFFTFLNAFWITVFVAIPFSVRYDKEKSGDDYIAAPKSINWKKLVTIAAISAVCVTVFLALIIESGIVSVHDWR